MDFPQFFSLLKTIQTKEDAEFQVSEENFPNYISNRYVSFISPTMCKLVNSTANVVGFFGEDFNDSENLYKFYKAIIPKSRGIRIPYKKKGSTEAVKKMEVSEEDISRLANLYEISRREVIEYITEIFQNKNNVENI